MSPWRYRLAKPRVETGVRGQYAHTRSEQTTAVTRISKSILAAAMLTGAIVLAGCVQTQNIDQTMPPYASISDEGRDPASAPKPAASDDSGGFMNALGSVLMFPVRMIEAL